MLAERSEEVDPEERDHEYLLSKSFEICGEQATWDALREAGATNPRIEAFRSAAWEGHHRPFGEPGQHTKVATLRYEQLLNEPMNKPFQFRRWGEQASDEELLLAASGLIAATDSKQKLAHLQIFAQRWFPLDVNALLALVDVEEDRVGLAAVRALTQIEDPSVRSLAFRLMETCSSHRGNAIDLIERNFEPGDHQRVMRWFLDEQDRHQRHGLGLDLRHFWESHPDAETEISMLLSLYEKGPCSFCRETAIEDLIKRNALPDAIRAECHWDASFEIRDLVARPEPIVGDPI